MNGIGDRINGIKQTKSGMSKDEVIGFTLGIILFGITFYAMQLTIKSNKLVIKKLKDEGYE